MADTDLTVYDNAKHPAADSAGNLQYRDVVGNKDDTIDGSSLMSFIKLIKSDHIISGTSPNTAGTANTSVRIELDGSASAVDGAYDPAIIYILSGTGAGQSRQIFEYVGATKLAYVNRDWKVTPDDTSVYCVVMDAGNTHVNEGVAQAGANNTITLNSLASAQNSIYLGQTVFISAGTGADQSRMIVGYDGGTKVATVDADWIVNPDTTSVYAMLPYPGFVHGVPGADSAANTLVRDVVGNKTDTIAGDSIVAIAKQTLAETVELDSHIHNREKWFGEAAVAAAETHVADRMAGAIDPFQLTAGNDDFGAWVQVLGSSDTPVVAGMTKFDGHRVIVINTNSTNPFIVQVASGESAALAAKVAAEEFTEFPYVAASNNNDSGISDIMSTRTNVGEKVWARCACIGSNGSTMDFYFGIHEYVV